MMADLTLLEEIRETERAIRETENALNAQKKWLRNLEDQRANCSHVWSKPYPGYEHEGRNCKLCGINEIYADAISAEFRKLQIAIDTEVLSAYNKS